jgi:flagellar biosynthesis anti-sigma factor FlgM
MFFDPKIQLPDSSQPDPVNNTKNASTPSSGSAKAAGVSSATGEDAFSLSSAHGEVQVLAANLAKVPEIRTARVSALSEKVRQGQFQPPSQQVADAIIRDHGKVSFQA